MRRTTTSMLIGLVWALSAQVGNTQEPASNSGPVQLGSTKALGVANYRLDHRTKVIGWKLSDRWFFGRQKGEDSGLTLVWQHTRDQVSISKEGFRFTRRF